ncbi:predicted protein [Histoplasma capsulatum var. duboisii H88]|uniref:Predicted protein n=1 Tax=Ajellomyces capsulatus (strain H88) TaxID=544711 RepID=F0UVV9_AJEC8|nr:predicted protein [Histoplasma capsulatum var. duboisii H88]
MAKDSDGVMKRDGLKDETGSMARIDTVHMRLPDRVTVGGAVMLGSENLRYLLPGSIAVERMLASSGKPARDRSVAWQNGMLHPKHGPLIGAYAISVIHDGGDGELAAFSEKEISGNPIWMLMAVEFVIHLGLIFSISGNCQLNNQDALNPFSSDTSSPGPCGIWTVGIQKEELSTRGPPRPFYPEVEPTSEQVCSPGNPVALGLLIPSLLLVWFFVDPVDVQGFAKVGSLPGLVDLSSLNWDGVELQTCNLRRIGKDSRSACFFQRAQLLQL